MKVYQRPMNRIMKPLSQMGVIDSKEGYLPLKFLKRRFKWDTL